METPDVPTMPWEISLKNTTWFITDRPEGGKIVKFVPVSVTPSGLAPTGMAVEIGFPAEAWEKFGADVTLGERGVSKVIVPQPGKNGHLN